MSMSKSSHQNIRLHKHTHAHSGTELCMPAILSNVLIQHDKTSVIYKLIERNVF